MNNFFVRFCLFTTTFLAFGCSGTLGGKAPIGRSGIGGGHEKPTADCTTARTAVAQILQGNDNVDTIKNVTLPKKACGVSVRVHKIAQTLTVAEKVKSATGLYSFIGVGAKKTALIQVLYDETPQAYKPVRDPEGNVKDAKVTVADCTAVVALLSAAQPKGQVSVVTDPSSENPGACFVQISFKLDGDFEGFLTWKNPTDQLFYWGYPRGTGEPTISVPIRAIRTSE